MQGYKIFIKEKEALLRQTMEDGSKYYPVQDINGDWFIFEKEYKHCGLGELTEYVAPEPEIIQE